MSLKILNIENYCSGCGACASSCPRSVIELKYNNEGFYYPHIDFEHCINCKACEEVCHVLNLKINNEPSKNYFSFICKSIDKDILSRSSSGGVFSILSKVVLDRGGVVYGARYDYDEERLHHCSTEQYHLDELRKSKYIESYTGTIFKEIGNKLKNGCEVLFCGTPCQLAGLTTYLDKKKLPLDNLIRVRFVCHGVPSNKFFTEYKHFEEDRYGGKILHFDFRPKNNGWASSDWLMEFDNGKSNKGIFTKYNYYYYYSAFYKNYLLRKSCYNCKHLNHELADFTIADFWGIKYYRPTHKEQEGISLVLSHSIKAQSILKNIEEYCEIEQLPTQFAEYIYKDANDKMIMLQARNQMMNQVNTVGYMNFIRVKLRKEIIISKIKGTLSILKRKILQ